MRRTPTALGAALSLVLVAATLGVPHRAAFGATKAAPDPQVAAQSLLTSVRRIAGKVEGLRGEEFVRPPIAVRVPDDLREAAAEIRAFSIVTRERLRARGRAWADLGLGGSASPERLVTVLSRDVAGIGFDPSENRLLVAPDRLTEEDYVPKAELDGPATLLLLTGVRRDEPLVGHLLMHVRQRERDSGDYLGATTDVLLARAALAEGEANLLALRYLFEGLGMENDASAFSLAPEEYLDGALVPRGLAEMIGAEADMIRFVYNEGFGQAVDLFRAGGWARVDKAIRTARTTRDVLHPDRGRLPEAQFGPPAAPGAGLELVDEDSLGEQGLIVLVSRVAGKDNLALQVGDGWVGDRLYRWEGAGESAATEWVTRWATPDDAEDFMWAWGKMFRARFPDSAPRDVEGAVVLSTPEQTFRIERSPVEVRVLVRSGPAARVPADNLSAPGPQTP